MPTPTESHHGMYPAALAIGFEWQPVEDRLHFTPNTQFVEPPGIVQFGDARHCGSAGIDKRSLLMKQIFCKCGGIQTLHE